MVKKIIVAPFICLTTDAALVAAAVANVTKGATIVIYNCRLVTLAILCQFDSRIKINVALPFIKLTTDSVTVAETVANLIKGCNYHNLLMWMVFIFS